MTWRVSMRSKSILWEKGTRDGGIRGRTPNQTEFGSSERNVEGGIPAMSGGKGE